MINEAIKFASLAHMGMRRKGNDQPYIFHPLEVLNLVSMMTLDEEVLCAAILHDTVEDTDATIEDIRKNFNERVASLVGYESEDKRGNVNKAATWKKRKEETIERISSLYDEGAKMICLADKVSNLRSIHLGLLDKGEEFWQSFNQKDPKEHYWYYSKLRDALVSLKDHAVYKEFCFLIDTIFKNMGEKNEE